MSVGIAPGWPYQLLFMSAGISPGWPYQLLCMSAGRAPGWPYQLLCMSAGRASGWPYQLLCMPTSQHEHFQAGSIPSSFLKFLFEQYYIITGHGVSLTSGLFQHYRLYMLKFIHGLCIYCFTDSSYDKHVGRQLNIACILHLLKYYFGMKALDLVVISYQ